MLKNDLITIDICDSSIININDFDKNILQYFAENYNDPSIFHISSSYNKIDEPIIYYNYSNQKWWSGRYIGDIFFKYNNQNIRLNIKPRFGNTLLLKMISELYNIQFSSSLSGIMSDNESYYLKILIAFIWIHKLSNCNRHGLPKIKTVKQHNSFNQRGKLLVRQSAISSKTTGKVLSQNREKVFDPLIIKILYQAFQILKNNYRLGELKIPANAQEAIHDLNENINDLTYISYNEYKSIKYHPIYQNYKDLIDFSWQIINSNHGFSNDKNKTNIQGFFIDVAEIWEYFIKGHIDKILKPFGWQIINNKYEVYSDCFYKRHIIPDIVLKKNNKYIVLDAKYKKMNYEYNDLDREDFFQIHSYISYLQTEGEVVLGGLIYPITEKNNINQNKNTKQFLWGNNKTIFIVDGPLINNENIYFDGFNNILFNLIVFNNYYVHKK